ncbi:hypothetical protein ACFL5S_02065, partial [Fibrobacterota bacterium]
LSIIVIIGITSIYADKVATTEDGKKVILKDNGTWKYASPSEIEALKRTPSTKKADASSQAVQTSKDISTIVDELKTSTTDDFRSVRWGMTVAQVKQTEKLKLLEEEMESLKYDYTLIGMKCNILYHFKAGKLASARYTIQQKHHDPALFNKDFVSLKKHLRLMYGAPATIQDNWGNDQFKSDESKWGFAVSIGFLTRLVTWRTGETKVALQMEGQNHEIFINIKYASLK